MPIPMPIHLFVYGTLRRASPHPLARRLAARARLLGAASAPGALYDLRAYPGALFDLVSRGRVRGEVYALHTSDPLLRIIDAYEGCAEGEATSSGFGRIPLVVTLDTGRQLEALSYGLAARPLRARPIASGDWIAHLAIRKPRARQR
jgi:gamma-glutamylcyclotransferase (GGCT)/AIG2-like uncharacterized protein YtfP